MTTRRLAAILAADVVGFSKLMGQDEEGTLARIRALRRDVIEPKVQEHHGRLVKTTGDGFLVEFASPVEAVRCAVGMEEAIAWGEKARRERSDNVAAARIIAAASALAGKMGQARIAMRRVGELAPALRVSNLCETLGPYAPDRYARYEQALRLAGLPE